MPWKKGYDQGFIDGVKGKDSKIKQVTSGPFISIVDMDVKQAFDKGYLAGYKDGEKRFKTINSQPFF